uniref:Uncharacterized protein n=1 Tax=Siphoviridae sp. ctDOT22 TaxID=2827812 RepID=A0A8S5SVI2_9CAUD|nr:MAG TPA: hypothetical protein [Siphoviridae sp. ctDOT22]
MSKNIITVTLSGILPRVSAFIDGFKDDDVELEVKKDLTQGDLEEYEVNLSYDSDKVEDPIIVLKKSLPDTINLMNTATQSRYYGMNEDLINLKDSIPTDYLSFDYYPDRLKILGKDLYSAINIIRAEKEVESDSVYVNAFLDIAHLLLFEQQPYTKYSMRNERDVLNLYTLACQDLMREGNTQGIILVNVLNLALNAMFSSVHRGKVKISEKIVNPNKFSIQKYLRDSQYDYDKVVMTNRVEFYDGNYPKSSFFIKEVNKKLDNVSDKGVDFIESLYHDALNEIANVKDDDVVNSVDRTWELYKIGL